MKLDLLNRKSGVSDFVLQLALKAEKEELGKEKRMEYYRHVEAKKKKRCVEVSLLPKYQVGSRMQRYYIVVTPWEVTLTRHVR